MKQSSNKYVTLVTGGSRCGKSSHALALCNRHEGNKIFLATAEARDDEMTERIRRHKEERGAEWRTVEQPLEIADALVRLSGPGRVVLLDCITLWLSNLLMKYRNDEETVVAHVRTLRDVLAACTGPVIVVTNEVGMGIVPGDSLSRLYRDLAGSANQAIASVAGTVILMVSGIPLEVKSPPAPQ